MEAKELRIGNFVLWANDICEIKGIHTQTVGRTHERDFHFYIHNHSNQNMNYYGVEPDDIKEIPLTEEWFLKFGFIKKSNWVKSLNDVYNLELMKIVLIEYCVFHIEKRINTVHNLNRIKYVHQLQNLHFALTGEELKITS